MKWNTIWMPLLPALALAQQPSDDRLKQLEARVAELELAQKAPSKEIPLTASWSDGLKLSSRDQAYVLQIGGRLQYDLGYIDADDKLDEKLGHPGDESGFRRALIKFSGTIHSNLDYLAMFDFANDEVKPLDNWIQLRNIPVLDRVRAGHFKEPMGLDILASSRDLMFMERAPVLLALAPIYNTGVSVIQNHWDKRLYATVGAFRETDVQARSKDADANHLTGRLVALPVYEDGGKELVHLGVSGSYQTPTADTVRYSSKPGYFFAPTFADAKAISNVSSVVEYGLEAAAVWHSFTFMSEYLAAEPDMDADAPSFCGWYVQAGWFLTGESHPYSRDDARFIRQKPLRNFTSGTGPGAWEIVARQASLDLDSGAIHGGQLDTTTAGLNWYLDPNLRVMLDYTVAEEDGVGTADIVAVRTQIDF